MTIDGYLNILAQIIFLLLAAITLLGWARQRNQTRLDIALVFTSLAIYFIFQDLQNSYQGTPPLPIALLTAFGLLAQPYLLLRVARYFRRPSARVQWAALLGFGFSCAILAAGEVFFANNTPVLFLVLAIIVGYFIIVEAYASLLLVQGAFRLSGITGKRLRLASIGSGLLASLFVIFLIVIGLAVTHLITTDQAQGIWLKALLQVFFILSGLCYYLGFAPPRWLSRAWQLDELHRYLQETSAEPTHERAAAFDLLSIAARRSVGGSEGGVAAWDFADQQLKLELGGDPPWQTNGLAEDPGVLGQAWRSRQARVARLSSDLGLEAMAWAGQVKAQSLFVVPIVGAAEAWGLLIVAVPHAPLFAEDDLDLLVVLARQTAATLDYAAVIEHLHTLNQSLETRVAERTTELSRVNRALRTISDCNQVLVRSRSESDLLNQVCRIIIEAGGYRMVWVGYPERDDPKTVRPVAWAGAEDGFLDLIQPSWGDSEQGRAPLGLAIRTGQSQIVRVAADPVYPAWQAAALQRGYAACLALPFFDNSRVFGGLSIFASEPDAFDVAEVNLLSELAADLAFGLTALRTQAAHDRAEAVLQQREASFRLLFANNPHPMWVYDLETLAFLEINEVAVERYGYTRAEFLAMRITDIRPPEDVSRLQATLAVPRPALQTSTEWRHRLKSGRLIEVEITSHTLDYEGRPAVLVVAQDISDRIQAEAQARLSAARLKTLAEISGALAAVQLDYRAVLNTAVRLISETVGDLSTLRMVSDDGQWLDEAVVHHPDPLALAVYRQMMTAAPQRAQEGLAGQVVQTGEPILMPVAPQEQLRTSLGPEYLFYMDRIGLQSLIAVPLFGLKGVSGVLINTRDRPGNPYTSADLAQLQGLADRTALAVINAGLYRNVQHELAERQRAEATLRVTLAKLELNNRELQDFAYVASHDLQEPLRKIQAFGDRLKRRAGDLLDETTRDYLDRMQNAAGRMQALINDLLTFSRVTTKAQPFVAIDLAVVVREVLSDLEIRVERSNGQVEIGPLPTLEADPTQMRQVLQNLLGNALKFHKPDIPPRVRVYSNLNGASCELIVSDNGIGFEEKYLDRIFTPFQRLHGRGEYEGTGIGLSVVRKIVERHGGQVTAHSRPDEGSTFIVTLPLKQALETTRQSL